MHRGASIEAHASRCYGRRERRAADRHQCGRHDGKHDGMEAAGAECMVLQSEFAIVYAIVWRGMAHALRWWASGHHWRLQAGQARLSSHSRLSLVTRLKVICAPGWRFRDRGPLRIAIGIGRLSTEERPSFGSLSRKRAENAAEPRFALFGLRCLFIVFIGLDGIVCGVCTGLRVLDAVRAVQL